MIKVTIIPARKELTISEGTLVLDVLQKAGILIPTPCGANGNCGKCKVLVYPQHTRPTVNEQKWISQEDIKKGYRLACQCRLNKSCSIKIPSHVIKDQDNCLIKITNTPIFNGTYVPEQKIKKLHLKVKSPTLIDQRSDWTRLREEINKKSENHLQDWEIPADILADIPKILRKNNFEITIVIFGNTIIKAEEGDTRGHFYGVAFDIGTTTISGYLINLSNNKEVAVETCSNPQRAYGDDVISRIDFARKEPGNKIILQSNLVSILNQIILSLTEKTGIDYRKIYLASFAGNTCMHHFLWSLPTENLSISPYVPVITEMMLKESRDLPKFCLIPHAQLYTAPNLSAYIGGDIIAGLVDISIWQRTGNILMIDLGTNGEIILKAGGKIWGCSAAAGPAFEGARISSGMRATYGAIDRVKISEKEIDYHVIGETKAAGICGSGIVDLLAELLRLHIIKPDGQLVQREYCPDNISIALKKRIISRDQVKQFLLVSGYESATGKPIYLSQMDIRQIQLAKGAVAAGIRILLDKARIRPEEIERIFLAGSFGNIIDAGNALKIGIIPDISLDRVHNIGNAAGRGAEKLLLSEEMRRKANQLSKKIQYIELSSYKGFQELFMDSLIFNILY